ATGREVADGVNHAVHFLVVDDVRRSCLVARHAQAVVQPVYRDHALRAEHSRTGHGELPNRAGPPNGYHVARFYVAHLRAHVSGGEDVRQEQRLLVRHAVRHLQRAHVGEGYAHVLRLSACKPAERVRIPEHAGCRVAVHLLGNVRIGVGVLAAGIESLATLVAAAARDGEGNHHAVTHLQVADTSPHVHHLSHELVAEYVAGLHGGNEALVEVQVGTAYRGGRHPHYGVALVQYSRVRHVADFHLPLAHPAGCLHDASPSGIRC